MGKVSSIGLNSLDNLFGDDVENTVLKTDIELDKLKPFENHPFSLYVDDEMDKLVDSIKAHGLFTPIIVRPLKDKEYTHEIVTGHNRVEASKLAGLRTITCDVRDLDDILATIIMVDSNLNQRQYIKPSEKAKAYKMRLEAIKSQGKRNDLTSTQLVSKLRSNELVGDNDNVSRETIRRYIRLNNLSPDLLKKVDDKKLAITSAVELSYLNEDQQAEVFDILSAEEKYGVPLKIAGKLRGVATHGKLTREKIEDYITCCIKKSPRDFKISMEYITKYFTEDATPSDISNTIDKALEMYFKNTSHKSISISPKER